MDPLTLFIIGVWITAAILENEHDPDEEDDTSDSDEE